MNHFLLRRYSNAAVSRAITISSNATHAGANAGDGAVDDDDPSNAPLLLS